MDTVKTSIIVVVCLALGGVAGAFVVQNRLEPRLDASSIEQKQLQKAFAELKEGADLAAKRVQRLERDNEGLERQVTSLRTKSQGFQATGLAGRWRPGAPITEDESLPGLDASLASDTTQVAAAPAQETSSERDSQWSEEEREARRTRMREWMDQRRESVYAFMDVEMERAEDETARARITSLQEYYEFTVEVMRDLRNAQSDEEREALRASLADAMETSRELLNEQQDHMLRRIASEHGITSSEDQDRFVASFRETMSSPFFRAQGGMMGWGGRSFRRGSRMPALAPAQRGPRQ